jgi:hypothetical protein
MTRWKETLHASLIEKRAAHLGFANRVVVRKIGFGILFLVAPQAVLHELTEVLRDVVRRDCLGLVLSGKRWSEQERKRNGEEKSEEQSTSPHSDLPKYYAE